MQVCGAFFYMFINFIHLQDICVHLGGSKGCDISLKLLEKSANQY